MLDGRLAAIVHAQQVVLSCLLSVVVFDVEVCRASFCTVAVRTD